MKLHFLLKRKYTFFISIIIGIAGLLVFNGCQKNNPIVIGVVGTMTGIQSDLSVSGRRGIEIAVKEINESGGIHGQSIVLNIKDDMNDPEQSIKIVNEFVSEGIEVVIGNYTSGMLTAAYDTIQKNDILYIGPTVSADSLNALDDHFIRFIPTTAEQADAIITDVKKNNYKQFMMIIDEKNKGFSDALRQNFEEQLVLLGGKIDKLIPFTSLETSDLEGIVSYLQDNQNIDSIFMIANGADIAAVTQQLARNNVKMPVIYGPLWSHTSDLLSKGGTSVEGIRVVSGIDVNAESSEFIEFKQKYYVMCGEEVTFAAMYSYETMMAIADALKSTKKTDWESIKNAIIQKQHFKGLQSEFTIDSFGDNKREYFIDTILNGVYKRID